jgi:hypothetical protein
VRGNFTKSFGCVVRPAGRQTTVYSRAERRSRDRARIQRACARKYLHVRGPRGAGGDSAPLAVDCLWGGGGGGAGGGGGVRVLTTAWAGWGGGADGRPTSDSVPRRPRRTHRPPPSAAPQETRGSTRIAHAFDVSVLNGRAVGKVEPAPRDDVNGTFRSPGQGKTYGDQPATKTNTAIRNFEKGQSSRTFPSPAGPAVPLSAQLYIVGATRPEGPRLSAAPFTLGPNDRPRLLALSVPTRFGRPRPQRSYKQRLFIRLLGDPKHK